MNDANQTPKNVEVKGGFCHLHVHSDGSLLDGFSTVKELLDEAERVGQTALATTEHGNLHYAFELYSQATARGMKPIIGIEAYVAPGYVSHTVSEPVFFDEGGPDDISGKGAYTHMLLFAENNVGLKNLFKLSELSYSEGFYRKPRISVDLLRKYGEGLIGTTGCPSGAIQTHLRLGQYDQALEYARTLQEILGKDNYFMELMNHDMSIDLETKVLPDLLRIAKELDIPLLATNDAHYARAEDADGHEHLLCISTGSKMSVPTSREEGEGGKTRFAFDGNGYYIKSYEEMAEIFPEDKFPGALSNTIKIAERCNVTIEPDDSLRPIIDLPEGMTEESYLEQQVMEGLARRLPDKVNDPEYLARIQTELDVIIPKGYSNYFLVVSDFIRWAKFEAEPRIPMGPGRGSAAGSLLAYCIDITDADPIRHGLLFERFLNPERDSPPDIDVDQNDTDRDRVIQYVKEKYGPDKVSYVVTFGKILAKNSVKDTARILDKEYSLGDRLNKAMPEPVFGKTMPLKYMFTPGAPRFEEASDFRDLVDKEQAHDLIEVARKLEGRTRSTGVHAAAVIISSKPVGESVPLMMRQKDREYITQWDYPTSEHLGLLKVDFLGLRNLGIIRDAVAHVKRIHGIDLDVTEMMQGGLDDPATYKLLQAGLTEGVFQVEGSGMQSLLRLMQPTEFADISAALALYRPGPMGVGAEKTFALRKTGKIPVDYIHPELATLLKPILGETQQVIVYQEQIQLIAREMAGYSLGQADNLRRAMGKKKREILEAEFIPFQAGSRARGYSDEAIQAIWDVMVPFADYAFNKSHTVAYGLVTYITAYLKANYPASYFAALLSSVTDDSDKTAAYLEDARKFRVQVLPPDVSVSDVDYVPIDDKTVRFGLKAIRGVGMAVCEAIVRERKSGGEFSTLDEAFSRLPKEVINKRVLEGLIQAGALDAFGHTRRALMNQLPELLKQYQKAAKARVKAKEVSLFDLLGDDALQTDEYKVQPMEEYGRLEKLKLERGVLGLYVSGHPIDGLNVSAMATATVSAIVSGSIKPHVGFPPRGSTPQRLAGVVTSLMMRRTKKGDVFGIAKLEDRSGSMECLLFPKTWEKFGEFISVDGVFQMVGHSQVRDEGGDISFVVDSVRPLEFGDSGNLAVRVKLMEAQWLKGGDALEGILMRHTPPTGEPGDDVIVSLRSVAGDVREIVLPGRVRRSPALLQELQSIFGARCVGRWRVNPETGKASASEVPAEDGTVVPAPVAAPVAPAAPQTLWS